VKIPEEVRTRGGRGKGGGYQNRLLEQKQLMEGKRKDPIYKKFISAKGGLGDGARKGVEVLGSGIIRGRMERGK